MANDALKIIVEKNVPFVEPLRQVADVEYLPYAEITPDKVRDAHALIIRTRTRCNSELLAGSKVKFIGTATIGTDHIDMKWCAEKGIAVANAPGSNAPAVAQYVFSSLARVVNRPLASYTLGIVGVGHIGSIVEEWGRSLGMKVLACDPPRGLPLTLSDLAARADIITFHTPLTTGGEHPTYHLADTAFFNSLRRAPIVVNSARGAVVDNRAWLGALSEGLCGPAIIDCWEGEPDIDTDLLAKAAIATPHIAGYSLEGKARASQMVLKALCRHFDLPEVKISGIIPPERASSITVKEALDSYNPLPESEALKSFPENFENLRNDYVLRAEPRTAIDN